MSLLIACCCGEIVAGGAFTAPGAGGGNLRRVARWNGSSWDEVGARTANTTTWSFGTYVNELYAGDMLDCVITFSGTDTGAAGTMVGEVGRVEMLLDIRG